MPISLGNNASFSSEPELGETLVTDTLPPGVTVISIETSKGTCSQTGSTITCNLGELDPDSTVTIKVKVLVTADASSQICNTAEVDSFLDISDGDNVAIECTQVTRPATPTPTPTPTADENKDKNCKLTELQKLNLEKTSTGGFEDVGTEGIIVGYRKGPDSALVLAPNIKIPDRRCSTSTIQVHQRPHPERGRDRAGSALQGRRRPHR